MSSVGGVAAVNASFVFLKVAKYDPETSSYKGDRILAKRLSDVGKDDPELERPITEYREVTYLLPSEAASDRWFVWQDMDPYPDTWKLYARRTGDLFTPAGKRLVVDTNAHGGPEHPEVGTGGIHLGLHESLVVYQGAESPAEGSPWGIYLLDLEKEDPPVPVALTTEPGLSLTRPAVSGEYVVWQEGNFFGFNAYARRIEDGKLASERFLVAEGVRQLTFDRNIALFNSVAAINEGDVIIGAVKAVELALPGASDLGDANLDGRINLTDAVVVLNHLFVGGWRPRLRPADADESGKLDLSDAITILQYLFRGG